MKIVRVEPFNTGVILEFDRFISSDCCIKELGNSPFRVVNYSMINDHTVKIDNLLKGTDYSVYFNTVSERSNNRFFRCDDYRHKVINYIHPDDMTYHPSGMCPASPCILKLENGRILVSHDIFYQNMAQNITLIFYSDDNGITFSYLSTVTPCFWGKMFSHKGILYLMGHNGEYGDLLLYKSTDQGMSFLPSIVILKGGNKLTGGPHKAPMPIISFNHRLWTGIDFGSWNTGGHASGVVSVDEEADFYDPVNWIVSEFLPYSSQWPGVVKGKQFGLLEGNVVAKKDGTLVNFLRYGTGPDYDDYGKAIYLNVDKDHPEKQLTFGKVVSFNGNNSKFSIKYDHKTESYFTIVNRADREDTNKRNRLILMSSKDLDRWTDVKVLLDYSNWHEDYKKVGFQYVDFIFDDDKIRFVSRTAINGALNFHDSNCITYHETDYN
ncbi:MAG: exo-alpha-sialidase [Clostridia bacterium]|nr:exo-alpha-sialidase [Clostridia bacterium]